MPICQQHDYMSATCLYSYFTILSLSIATTRSYINLTYFGGSRIKIWWGNDRGPASGQNSVVLQLTVLDRGADPCATSKNQEWSPVKIATYHGVDSSIILLLKERAKEKLETSRSDNVWDEKLHASRQADRKEAWCGCCFAVSTLPTQVLVPSQSLL